MAATCAHDDDCEFAKPEAWLGHARYPRVPPRRRGQYPFGFSHAVSRAAKWDARPAFAACYAATLHTKPRIALHTFMQRLLEATNRASAAFAVDWDRVEEHFRVAVQAAHNESFLSRVYKMYAFDALTVAGVALQPVLVFKTILAVPVFELQQIALRTNALVLHNVTPHIALTHHVGRVLRNAGEHRPRKTYVTGLIVSEASGQRSLDVVLRDDFGIHSTHITATGSLSTAKKRQLYSIFAQVTHGLFAMSNIQLKRNGAGACWHHCDMKPANVAYCSVEPGAALTYAYTHEGETQKLRGITGVCRLIDFDTMSTNFDTYCFSNPQRYVAARRKAFRRDIGAWMQAVGRPASRSRSRGRSRSRSSSRSSQSQSQSRSRSRRAKTPDRDTPVVMDLVSFLVSTLPRHSSRRRQNFYNIPVAAFIVDIIRKLLRKHGDATDPVRDTRAVLWSVFCYFCAKANRGTPDADADEHFGEPASRDSRSQIQHELQQLQKQAPVEEPRQLAAAEEVPSRSRSRSRSRVRSRSSSRGLPLANFRRSARITALPQTAPLRLLLSEKALMQKRVVVEVKWLEFLSDHKGIEEVPPLSPAARQVLRRICEEFDDDDAREIKVIESSTGHDVKAVEYFLRRRFDSSSELRRVARFLHFACTSEDINNLAYACMVKGVMSDVVTPHMRSVVHNVSGLACAHATKAMLSLTHGQPATPTTFGKEMANFAYRLERQLQQSQVPIRGKMNGAVGNFNAHAVAYPNVDWLAAEKQFVRSLGLVPSVYTTQIEPHDWIAELCDALQRYNNILIGFNRDMWGYVSRGYLRQKVVASEVGSSTMPHKVNPIMFENAEGQLGVANAMLHHLSNKLPISRFQRDLSDSTVLRTLGPALAHSVLAYQSTLKGLARVYPDADAMNVDLDKSWEVLTEAVQTVMKRYGYDDAYEALKELSRGRKLDQASLHAVINSLEKLPPTVKLELLALTPRCYIGEACRLAQNLRDESPSFAGDT